MDRSGLNRMLDEVSLQEQSGQLNRLEAMILSQTAVLDFYLSAIHGELVKIREATETEAVEDAEPDPFQTLNGPRLVLTEEEAAMELSARQGLEGPFQTLNGPSQ